VRDASGAVLPGVTVEASSPALIEKVRSALTDGTGQYRITELRPGTYTVTFALAGFAPVRREGIELTGSFTATVNADLSEGGLARGNGHRQWPVTHRRRPEHEAAGRPGTGGHRLASLRQDSSDAGDPGPGCHGIERHPGCGRDRLAGGGQSTDHPRRSRYRLPHHGRRIPHVGKRPRPPMVEQPAQHREHRGSEQ